MKHFFFVVFLLFIGAQTFAQMNSDKMLYLQKIEKYHRMKRTGTTLTVLGSALSVVGLVTLLNSSTTTTSNGYGPSQTSTDGNPGAGLAAYLVGSACVGVGIPLWIVGGVNEGRYQRKFDDLTIEAGVAPQGGGFTLRYRF